jgi:hypothetical protein
MRLFALPFTGWLSGQVPLTGAIQSGSETASVLVDLVGASDVELLVGAARRGAHSGACGALGWPFGRRAMAKRTMAAVADAKNTRRRIRRKSDFFLPRRAMLVLLFGGSYRQQRPDL